MVNNSTNFNKNDQLPLTSNYWWQKRPRHLLMEKPFPGFRQTQKYGGVKPVKWIPISPPSRVWWCI